MTWVDSHCHLQERYVRPTPTAGASGASGFSGDVVAALTRAAAAGVTTVVCVGTDLATSRQALMLADDSRRGGFGGTVRQRDAGGPGGRLPRVWATVGLHPHEAESGTAGVIELLEEAAGSLEGTLVAVGECGLDYHYDHSPRPAQRRAFAEQVAVANRLDLALVIHARSAWDDLFGVLESEGVPDRTVLHCFTGGPVEARRCLDAGMYLSFSGIITFKSATEVRDAADLCPLDRLLIETDSPFLAPVPHRGKPNEPGFVPLVGEAVAAAKRIGPLDVAEASAVNAGAAFGIPPTTLRIGPTPGGNPEPHPDR